MSKGVSMTKSDKDPTGGLTARGRRKYNRATGGNLQAPVTKRQVFLLDRKQEENLFVQECQR